MPSAVLCVKTCDGILSNGDPSSAMLCTDRGVYKKNSWSCFDDLSHSVHRAERYRPTPVLWFINSRPSIPIRMSVVANVRFSGASKC